MVGARDTERTTKEMTINLLSTPAQGTYLHPDEERQAIGKGIRYSVTEWC